MERPEDRRRIVEIMPWFISSKGGTNLWTNVTSFVEPNDSKKKRYQVQRMSETNGYSSSLSINKELYRIVVHDLHEQ